MSVQRPTSCCRMCGATSYRLVIARDSNGAMTHTGLYRCCGCSVVFADPKSWREGGNDDLPPAVPPPKLKTAAQLHGEKPNVPEGPNLTTYGVVPSRPPTTG